VWVALATFGSVALKCAVREDHLAVLAVEPSPTRPGMPGPATPRPDSPRWRALHLPPAAEDLLAGSRGRNDERRISVADTPAEVTFPHRPALSW